MARPTTRTLAVALGVGLLAPALATLPSQAVVGSGTVPFNDCDVILNPLAENDRITQNGTWSVPVSVDHPSPIPVFSGQTVGFVLGDVPAELALAFWSVVVSVNVGLFAASLGLMLVYFRGQWRLGGGVVALGVGTLAYGYLKYRRYQQQHG